MILRTASLITTLGLLYVGTAEVAPEVTVVEEGYNYIAKLPCPGCPFLFQDTSEGENEPWTERKDNNALLLNVSLPYDSAFLTINNSPLYSGTRILPLIYANQVVQDFSADALSEALSSGQLEASHETNLGGGFFGLSYRHSLRTVQTSKNIEALLFQFDVVALHSDLTTPPLQFKLDDPAQKMLQVLLVQRAVLSAGDSSHSFEILSVKLVPRADLNHLRTMHFLSWDANGEKGTFSHYISSLTNSFIAFLSSGFWTLLGFIMAVIVVFVVVCLMCVFGWEYWKDDYEKAQQGKQRRKSSVKGGRVDVETGVGKMKGRFKSAEELGLGLPNRGQVVGMGKSD
ncbi:uncharacterized protein N0V89_006568 [Didymosphaeria variabile]|uniref:Uncharacterized protein n=1 Tax=Didymosphaeria variabile TaxID=1932322 RepID=A0A9W8XHK2_9PLEO|nr:uncharacterized protein N0V89_006568 [Didymosphaeria variabile]KAJ4351229.1 hypothetical protein N0V89_006568 [Didymosphaeria variabile]